MQTPHTGNALGSAWLSIFPHFRIDTSEQIRFRATEDHASGGSDEENLLEILDSRNQRRPGNGAT